MYENLYFTEVTRHYEKALKREGALSIDYPLYVSEMYCTVLPCNAHYLGNQNSNTGSLKSQIVIDRNS
jgi:hypothetical protein